MTSVVRKSPSGPVERLETTTDALENASLVPGASASDALLFLDRRRIQYLDVEDEPVGLWNFDETLDAVVGPSLTVDAGAVGFTPVAPGIFGIGIPVGARLVAPVTPSLAIAGDLSVEVLLQYNSDNANMVLLGHGSSAAGSANNTLYQLSRGQATTPRPVVFSWMNGSKAAQSYSTPTTSGSPSVPLQHNVFSVGWRRASNLLTPFINGVPFDSTSSTQVTPTGGSTGFLNVGSAPGALATGSVAILSIAIYDYARTNEQWRGSYNRSLGEGYGFLS